MAIQILTSPKVCFCTTIPEKIRASKIHVKMNETRISAVTMVELTVLVVTDFEGYFKSMIFISFERAYAISYWWSIVT